MDRTELSSAIIQEMQVLVGEALEAVMPELLTADLATLEQRVQQVGRVILGGLVERVATAQAQGLPRPARCAGCKGALKRRERPRPLVGLVGDYTLRRPYYWCAACKRGEAPLDAALGLGPGDVSPGLTRVVAGLDRRSAAERGQCPGVAVDATFTPAVEQVQEARGATLNDETAWRLAARIGAVAEAQTQAAITRARQGQPVWTADEMERANDTTILVVEVDGVLVHQEAGWHEMKVGTLAPPWPRAAHRPDARTRHPGVGVRALWGGRRGCRGLLVAGLRGGPATGPGPGHASGAHRGRAGRWGALDLGPGAPLPGPAPCGGGGDRGHLPRLRLSLGGGQRALWRGESTGGGVGRAAQGSALPARRGPRARGAHDAGADDGRSRAGHRRRPDLLYPQRGAHGLSALRLPAVAHWIGGRGERLHVPGRSAPQTGRHARGCLRPSSHRQSARRAALGALGGLLADAP